MNNQEVLGEAEEARERRQKAESAATEISALEKEGAEQRLLGTGEAKAGSAIEKLAKAPDR